MIVPGVSCAVAATVTVVPVTETLGLHVKPALPQVIAGIVVVVSVSVKPG